jgi:hypothetical protein
MPILTNILHRWTLPTERDFGWKMKSLDSAKTNFTVDKAGVFRLTIEHDRIKGVTPKMLLWWFSHIGGEMTYQGKSYPRYLVWHPRDHIFWSLAKKSTGTRVGQGSYFRIVEAFDRNREFLIDSTEYVEKLDETGIRLIKKAGTVEVFSLQHDFIKDGNNTIYKSRMIVGTDKKLIGRMFNYGIRPLIFSKAMAPAWLKHNIEEVGNFEFFLPELYDQELSKA